MLAVHDSAGNNGCQSRELDLEMAGDKITGRPKKRFQFLHFSQSLVCNPS